MLIGVFTFRANAYAFPRAGTNCIIAKPGAKKRPLLEKVQLFHSDEYGAATRFLPETEQCNEGRMPDSKSEKA